MKYYIADDDAVLLRESDDGGRWYFYSSPSEGVLVSGWELDPAIFVWGESIKEVSVLEIIETGFLAFPEYRASVLKELV